MNEIKWFDKARIYHIMVDRFNGGWQMPPPSGNDFCGGTLQGVIEKLDYIKYLGFNTIMLTPFLKTAGYHGYHTLSYDEIDSHFGTWEVFQNLLNIAHEKGLRVICDFVPNHCFYWSDIFQGALLDNGGKCRDWFFFPKKDSDEYVSFLNLPDLPKFNLENPQAAKYMVSKAERLAQMGVDGFRIDHAIGQPFSFLKYLRQTLKNVRSDIVVFGEVWAEGVSEELYDQFYFKTKDRQDEFFSALKRIGRKLIPFLGDFDEDEQEAKEKKILSQEHIQADYADVLDGVFDFTYQGIILDEVRAGRRIKENYALRRKLIEHFKNYPLDFKLVLFLDNHDTDRFLFECNNDVSLLKEAIELTQELNRPFAVLYGTEQLMTTDRSILGAEPYADLRVRQCMDWTQTPANILPVQNSNLPSISQKKMPIVNGNEWTLGEKALKEPKDEDIQPRKVSDNERVEWRSIEPNWDIPSLILQEHTQKQLNEISAYINKKDEYVDKWGVKRFMRSESCIGINFYGASGTGKSIAAEAVAKTCGRNIIKASYSQIQSDRWGGTENNLTSLFEEAKKTNSVIVLNEADGLFSKRRSNGANSETNNQIKCHILNLMDSYEVVLILTTNRFEDYDEAFYRRTMFQVEFPLPEHEELLQLWKMHLGCNDDKRFSDGGVIPKTISFSFENIASFSKGLSGGDIRRITLGAIGKILSLEGDPLLTEEIVISIIEDYKAKKNHVPQGNSREAIGKEKEDILKIVRK
ncbi:alpha-amylase family glycosyl hydrolase [uncultured Prevotella sp.]|uniref:alpha-amylase family glycosyl hydrolase n=1 Tax=uncultured Prevotella sp. TaxID=159272 RepID=UPI002673C3FC|nr:alpha-amylase family glycosyl hydrolase [uncultured Prevotella sp.]